VTGPATTSTRVLRQRLAEAEATIAALLSGEIDAVVDPRSQTPVLLAKAQEALRDSEMARLAIEEEYRQTLIDSERFYRSTFDAAPVGIVHMGLDGAWVRVNQRICDLLGYAAEELLCLPPSKLMEADDLLTHAEPFRRLTEGREDRHVVDEMRYRRRDRSALWARVNMSVHRDAANNPQHVILVIEDITERRTLEAQIRQSSKMDAIGRLASGVAHDFNNLLTVILGFTEIVSADAETVRLHGRDLGEVIKAAQRAAGLTRQLLAFSRQQVLQSVPFDLNGLIRDMTGMLSRLIGEHMLVTLGLATDLSLAFGDPGQMEQVVMNLVVNARDAMPEGGTITIETHNVDLERSAFHHEAVTPGSYVMLSITDTGTGMPLETQRRLFEPFFTTKEAGQGTGLGLSTTYGIVKQSKGYIWVYSEMGLGTTFKVYLPRAAAEAEVVVNAPAQVAAVTATEMVLLVEDEPAVRKLLKRLLDRSGYRVLEAANGDEAERLFSDEIQLVVTDIIMPGCGGPELLRRLQARSPALRVLYMSGYTEQSAARITGIDRGQPFVQKPFTARDFLAKVRTALAR
jgi:two-component system cell cycle sensor histidine kinase/response regulator CckA